MAGKQFTNLTKASDLKDTNIIAVHDGNGLKKASMEDVTMYMSNKFSNPNLLINPNFKINQRGQATYETSGANQIYSVDRWRLGKGKVTVNSDGTVTVTATGGTANEEGYYQQLLENAINGDYTVSVEAISVSGAVRIAIDGAWQNVKSGLNVFHGIAGTGAVGLQLANGASITLKWVKLEHGSIATPFVAPNPAEELVKCRRFAFLLDIDSLVCTLTGNACFILNYTDIIMRTNPTVSVINGSSENLIVRESMNSIATKNLGKPISFEGRSNGRIVRVVIQESNNAFTTITTHDGISALLLDAEIY